MSMEFLKRKFYDEAVTDQRLEEQLKQVDVELFYGNYYKSEIRQRHRPHVHNVERYLYHALDMTKQQERRGVIHYEQHLATEYDYIMVKLVEFEQEYSLGIDGRFASVTKLILQNIKYICDNLIRYKLENAPRTMPDFPDDLENDVYAIARRINVAAGRHADIVPDGEEFVARILADPSVFGLDYDEPLESFVDLHGLGLKERFRQVSATEEEKTQALIYVARLCGVALRPAEPEGAETAPGMDAEREGEATPAAPAVAPVLWRDRTPGRGTNPASFIREHYGEWLAAGLTRADIKHLDPELYQAYAQWIRPTRHPEDDLNLPTRALVRRADESPEQRLARQREQEAVRQKRYRDKQRSLTK